MKYICIKDDIGAVKSIVNTTRPGTYYPCSSKNFEYVLLVKIPRYSMSECGDVGRYMRDAARGNVYSDIIQYHLM